MFVDKFRNSYHGYYYPREMVTYGYCKTNYHENGNSCNPNPDAVDVYLGGRILRCSKLAEAVYKESPPDVISHCRRCQDHEAWDAITERCYIADNGQNLRRNPSNQFDILDEYTFNNENVFGRSMSRVVLNHILRPENTVDNEFIYIRTTHPSTYEFAKHPGVGFLW